MEEVQSRERWSCRNASCSNAARGRVYSPIFEVPKGKDSCLAWPQENWETNDGELSLVAWANSSLYVFPSHGATFVIGTSRQVQGNTTNPLPGQQLGSIESPRFPRNHEIKLPSSTGLGQSHQPKPFLSHAGSTTSKTAHHFLVALASFNSSSMEAAWRRFRNINSVAEHWKKHDKYASFNINWLINRKKTREDAPSTHLLLWVPRKWGSYPIGWLRLPTGKLACHCVAASLVSNSPWGRDKLQSLAPHYSFFSSLTIPAPKNWSSPHPILHPIPKINSV